MPTLCVLFPHGFLSMLCPLHLPMIKPPLGPNPLNVYPVRVGQA